MRFSPGSLQAPPAASSWQSSPRIVARGALPAEAGVINTINSVRLDGATPHTIQRMMTCRTADPAKEDIAAATLRKNVSAGNLREELDSLLPDFFRDLEARLTARIDEAASSAAAHVLALSYRTDEMQATLAKTRESQARADARITALEAQADAQAICAEQAIKDISEIKARKTCDMSSLPQKVLQNISDHVIERVNSDPRVCQLVESHQSLQDSFSKLLYLLEKAPPNIENKGSTQEEHEKASEKDTGLYDTMFEVQKCCKTIALEVRQVRQRRNQDYSETTLRFEALEKKQKGIEDILLGDDKNVDSLKARLLGKSDHDLPLLEEEAFEEETDVQ